MTSEKINNRLDAAIAFPTLKKLDQYRRIRLGLPCRKSSSRIPVGYEEVGGEFLEPIEDLIQTIFYLQSVHELYSFPDMTNYIYEKHGIMYDRRTLRQIIEKRALFEEASLPREEREKFLYMTL